VNSFLRPAGLLTKTQGSNPPVSRPTAAPVQPPPVPAQPAPAQTAQAAPAALQKTDVPPAPQTASAPEAVKNTPARDEARAGSTRPDTASTVTNTNTPAPETKDRVTTTERKPLQSVIKEKARREPVEDHRKANRDAALYAARNYEQTGNLSQAISSYEKSLQFDGKNYIVMTGLAGVLIRTGAYREAAQYSRLALNTRGNYAPAMINLAIASARLGNFEEAQQNLLRARSLEPANQAALVNLGLLYETRQQYPEALRVCESLAALNKGQGGICMGRILEKQGNRDEAKKVYRDILSSTNSDAPTKQYAGERLVALGN